MNERIEKLVIEAFFDEATNGAGQKMYTLGEEKMQKFAELIVRECCVALHPMLRDMISRDQGVHLIEKHFGDRRINERIEKMAVQSGFPDRAASNDFTDLHPQFEKFAEAIVRECAAIALREDHEPSECILKHFGVER